MLFLDKINTILKNPEQEQEDKDIFIIELLKAYFCISELITKILKENIENEQESTIEEIKDMFLAGESETINNWKDLFEEEVDFNFSDFQYLDSLLGKFLDFWKNNKNIDINQISCLSNLLDTKSKSFKLFEEPELQKLLLHQDLNNFYSIYEQISGNIDHPQDSS